MDGAETHLAEALRLLRRESGRSLKELEKLTATSDSSLSRYVNGTATPPWSVVDALCQAVGRDSRELRAVWEEARRARLDGYGRRDPTPAQVGGETSGTEPARVAVIPRVLAAATLVAVVGAAVTAVVMMRGRATAPCLGLGVPVSRIRPASVPRGAGRA